MLFTVLISTDRIDWQETGMVFDRLEAESYARALRDMGYYTRIVEWRA